MSVVPPQAPRAMRQSKDTDPPMSSLELEVHNTAMKLYPRLTLLEALSGVKDGHRPREKSRDDAWEARRDFLDSFAYLCDTEKGGATVTATALQRRLHGNTLWLAANEGIKNDIKLYAEAILLKLREMEFKPQDAVEEDIFKLVVEKCELRIQFYVGKTQEYARNCRMQLRQEPRDDHVRLLRSKFRKLSEPSASMTTSNLIDFCYAMRGREVDEIRKKSRDPGDDFSSLAHYVGRLGATRSCTNAIVSAVTKIDSLRRLPVDVRTLQAPKVREVTIGQEYTSPYEIVWAICNETTFKNPVQIQSALQNIVTLDLPPNHKIRKTLASRQPIITRVHAELQIADKFSRNQYMEFVDDDKYIGCSKPACYFCYNWLSLHKHQYVLPAAHNRIILGCRAFDDDINAAGATILKEMYTKLCGRLDQDILGFLLNSHSEVGQVRHHYMSTEGSSHAPSQL